MIDIQGLVKRYGDLVAVNHLDLEIGAGEIFGFLGPNGAGKTTTIRILVGLLRPTAGTARIAGYDVVKEPLKVKASIAYLPEQPFLYNELTGLQHLRLVCALYGVDRDAAARRLDRLLPLFDLQQAAGNLIASYSHGMRQKLAWCSVLVVEPKVLLLDEPFQALDPRGIRVIKDILKTLSANGMTIFLCTHILEIAEHICDRVGILNLGQIVAVGGLQDIQKNVGAGQSSLEDLFLELTGGPVYRDLISDLRESGPC
ncbi:MAG TPA: ABC transporter ATP-binding protein [Anaerolineae bacterium]|nr:ABC transporter ATP-binding protein [Anaerolineae bacterium]